MKKNRYIKEKRKSRILLASAILGGILGANSCLNIPKLFYKEQIKREVVKNIWHYSLRDMEIRLQTPTSLILYGPSKKEVFVKEGKLEEKAKNFSLENVAYGGICEATIEDYFTPTHIQEKNSSPTPHFDYTRRDVTMLAKLLFGEGRGANDNTLAAIAYSAVHRTIDGRWQDSLQKVITSPRQYTSFNYDNPNFRLINSNPGDYEKTNRVEWKRALRIAEGVLSGKIKDPTKLIGGATSYRDSSIPEVYQPFVRKHKKRGRLIIIPTGKDPRTGAEYIAYARD